jgi:GT2 family glycosyltransferase
MSATCSVVIVNWNAGAVARACIDSILHQDAEPPPEIIVVDNASTDCSKGVFREHGSRIRLIELDANLGFAKANNIGARFASGSVLVFLNPDTELKDPQSLRLLVENAVRPDVGLAAPQLLNPDFTIQPSCARFPSILSSLVTGLAFHRILPDSLRARLAPVSWSHQWSIDADWVKGAAIATRRGVFDSVGGWSEATFMYGEDLDLCYAVRRSGLRVLYDPSVRVVHCDDYSARQRWDSAQRAALVAEANVQFMRTRYGAARRAVLQAILALTCWARAVLLRVGARRERASIYYAMTRVYLTGRSHG